MYRPHTVMIPYLMGNGLQRSLESAPTIRLTASFVWETNHGLQPNYGLYSKIPYWKRQCNNEKYVFLKVWWTQAKPTYAEWTKTCESLFLIRWICLHLVNFTSKFKQSYLTWSISQVKSFKLNNISCV